MAHFTCNRPTCTPPPHGHTYMGLPDFVTQMLTGMVLSQRAWYQTHLSCKCLLHLSVTYTDSHYFSLYTHIWVIFHLGALLTS